jgi:hypothetical protein
MADAGPRAKAWAEQAESDARTAEALLKCPPPMRAEDVGCHVAAMCAQAVEKSIKGYVILNKGTPRLSHRADKYLPLLLGRSPLLRHKDHHSMLSALFDSATKADIRSLLDLTPGTLGKPNAPNTEYPWTDTVGHHLHPAGAVEFSSQSGVGRWLSTARRVSTILRKLIVAAGRGSP